MTNADKMVMDAIFKDAAEEKFVRSLSSSRVSLPRNIAISIERNPHVVFRVGVTQYVKENRINIDPGELAASVESGELWVVTWWPNTPVGACISAASTMQAAIGLASACQAEEDRDA